MENGPTGEPIMTFGEWISGSGVAGWIVVLLTIIAFVVAILRVLELRMSRLAPVGLQRALETAIHGGDLSRAAADAAASSSMLGKLAAAGLRMSDLGLDEMLANVERSATRESIALGNRVSNLSRIGGAVLLFGFLGTALGIMLMLRITSMTPGAPPFTDLAVGFSIAVSCVALALIAAIFCFGAFFFLDSRVTKNTIRVSEMADELQYLTAEKRARPAAG